MKDRYENRPGYKKTKAGWIPDEWKVLLAGDVFDIQLGKMLSEKARQGKNPQPYLANYNVQWGRFDLSEIQEMDFSKREMDKFQLKKGDILVCEGGEVGRCAVWDGQINPCFYQKALHRVRPKNDGVDVLFTMYYLHITVVSPRMVYYTAQTSISHFTREQFLKFPIVLPPLPEQEKVAEILSTWDKTIEQTRKLIEAKKRRKKALMQQLLTGKKRLPGFREEWKMYRMSDLVRQNFRPVKFDDKTNYQLISVRRRSEGIFFRGTISGHDILTKQLYLAQKGDFLISKMQIVHGASALVTKEFDGMHISGSYIALEVTEPKKMDINFLNWLSKTPYFYHLTYLSSYGVHIEKMTFNLRLLLKSKIKIPGRIDEQRQIVEVLSAADNEIEILKTKLPALEKQKRGLMQKLLTGEVRVKV